MIRSVCGYCGVGCGIEFDEKRLIGDIDHPTNEGLICSKGVSELATIQTSTRLLTPRIKDGSGSFQPLPWEIAINTVVNKINQSTPERIAFYLSGQLMTEDYYLANKLAKGFVKTPHVDTNSRMCMSSAVVAYKKSFGIDYVPVTMEDLPHCDLLVLAGSNAAESHVVLFNKIKKEKKRGMKLVVIDPRRTDTAALADLHIPIKPGGDIDFFNCVAKRLVVEERCDEPFLEAHVENTASYKRSIRRFSHAKGLKRAGIDEATFEAFMALFYANPNLITGWTMGLNQSVQGVDKNLAVINLHLLSGKLLKKGNGPFSLTGQPNAMGGREVGGLSTMLAVHLDYSPGNVKKVEEFWRTEGMPTAPGLTAFELIEAAETDKLDLLIISHTDPLYHLPDRKRVEAALAKIPFIVELNAYDDSETSAYAHLQLPAAPWGEKEGVQTNMDRTLSKQEPLSRSLGECKPDWKIFAMIGERLGFGDAFGYTHVREVFEEYRQMCRLSERGHLNIFDTDYEALAERPFRWGEEALKEGFYTPSKKAQLLYVENKKGSMKPSRDYPFLLLTGRIRDQWHSGTKTGHIDKLHRHKPASFIEMNPHDAKKAGCSDGDIVAIKSPYGVLITKAVVTETIPRGLLFVPVTERKINNLTPSLLDPLSKEPDYNHTTVSIKKVIA